MKGEWAKLVLAAQFLTRLPLRTDRLFSAGRMADAPRYFPLVGLLIGVASAGAYWLAALALPHLVAVIVAICAGLLLTGAFHEDGLADTFDGIGGGLTRDQSLEIMKDSRLGTYGTAALVGALALKAAALAAMPPFWVIASLPLAHCASRLSAVLVIATISLALAIIAEATLSFLGVGVPPTQPSLGTLIRVGQSFLISGEWWILLFPALTLLALALSVNLLGDWLRDALNPRLR